MTLKTIKIIKGIVFWSALVGAGTIMISSLILEQGQQQAMRFSQDITCDGMHITVYDLPHAYPEAELCESILFE